MTDETIASWDDRQPLPSARDPAPDPTPPPAYLAALRKSWGQIAAIIVIATFVAWFSRLWSPTPWNAVIWLGSPIIIACLGKKGIARFWFAPLLALIFFAALIVNEAAAHLIFGTCLYD